MKMKSFSETLLCQRVVASPVGPIRLLASDQALVGLYFAEHRYAPESFAMQAERHPILDRAARQLGEYFAGERTTFELPVDVTRFSASVFQTAVWQRLLTIAFGQTRSYGEIAAELGLPGAARAVGAANARNPVSIIVPCHRVIGASGLLTGYGGGIETKRFLLSHESAIPRAAAPILPNSFLQ